MQIHSADFEISSADLAGCPTASLPEFAFVGRSNVGKSSLINMLSGQKKNIAIVSSTPGRTRLINFFNINKKWKLVDLPGYGYAKISKTDQGKFQEFVSDYLLNRETLRCVFVLIDSKIPPQQLDLRFTQWLMESNIPFVLVFTKADKAKPGAVRRNPDACLHSMSEFCEGLPKFFTSSAKSRDGRREILGFIDSAINNP
jgi:GTP-binding protein